MIRFGFVFTFMKTLLPQRANEIPNEFTWIRRPYCRTPPVIVWLSFLLGVKKYKNIVKCIKKSSLTVHPLPPFLFRCRPGVGIGRLGDLRPSPQTVDDHQSFVLLPSSLCVAACAEQDQVFSGLSKCGFLRPEVIRCPRPTALGTPVTHFQYTSWKALPWHTAAGF